MTVTSRALKVTLSALMAATIAAVACTNDYDQFHSPEAVAAGTSGSSAATGGSSGTGGSGGAVISGGTGPTGGSGGTLAGGSGGVPTGGVGGAGGSVGGTGGSGGTGGGTTCTSGQKLCSTGACVATDQITTGCGQTSCDPCSATVLHATPVCDPNTGYCVYQAPNCDPGYGDCNFLLTDGCEAATSGTVLHCGGCESFRTCSETNVASVDCPDTVCTSTCQLGFGNCTTPSWPQADNGCETNTTADNGNCGGCGNNCALQSSGFTCQNMTCGCTSDTQCKVGSGNPSGTITCNTTSRRCVCAGLTCNAGETCNRNTNWACSCNGAAACGAGSTCCQTPAGCKNLTSDPSSCGACGHVCPLGFACSGGQCVCDADSDCNFGSAGVCSGGVCVCGAASDGGAGTAGAGATDSGGDDSGADASTGGAGGTATPCGAGQRCLPTGSCG